MARLQTREEQAKLRLRYGGYFAAAAKSALDLAAKRDQLSKEEMVHVYRIIGQLMETSSQLLYYVDADATTRNNLVKLLNNWVTSPKMLAEGFVISRTVQGSQTKLYQFLLPNFTNQSSRVFLIFRTRSDRPSDLLFAVLSASRTSTATTSSSGSSRRSL